MRKFLFTAIVIVSLINGKSLAQVKPQLNINLYRTPENAFADGVVAIYDNAYSTGIGVEDATKFTNFTETFALLRDASRLSIEGRPLIAGKDSLFLGMQNFNKRSYTISIDASNFTGILGYIEDRYTGNKQAMNMAGNTAYTFTVNNDAASGDDTRFALTFINTTAFATWLGTTNTDWGTSSNWSGNNIPNSSSDVIIPTAANMPQIASGYQFAVKSLEILSTASVVLNNTCVLTAGGAIINYGTISGPGKLSLNGSVVQNLTGAGTYSNLELNNGAGALIPSGNTVNITGRYMPSAGTLTNSGSFILKSSATATAAIAQGSGTYITGNVTVERYIPSDGRKRYTSVTSPVNSPSIYNAWQEAGVNTNAGYGTQITGAAAGNGFDAASASGGASIFNYNDNNATGLKWVGLTNTNVNTLAPGTGFLIYVRGDRSITPATTTGNNTVLRATGTLATGTVAFSSGLITGATKFNLIANPYPAAIDWTSVSITKTNLSAFFTVYDPNLGVFVTSNGSIKSPNAGQQQAAYIQSGQAFFIQNDASGNTPAITFTEGAKTTSATTNASTTVFGSSVKPQLNINVYRDDNTLADGAVAVFDGNFKAGIDKEDAAKMNNFTETFSLKRGTEKLGIEGRPLVATTDTLYLNLANFSKKAYTLRINGSDFTGLTAVLIDRYTNSRQTLDINNENAYKFEINGNEGSSADSRFMIVLGNAAKENLVNDLTGNTDLFVKLSPNPVTDQLSVSFKTGSTENKIIRIVNALGQVAKTINTGKSISGTLHVSVSSLPAGIYTVQLLSGGKAVASHELVIGKR